MTVITIAPFIPDYIVPVGTLISSIQQQEFQIPITLADQPDLSDIPRFYQHGDGNFWIALYDGAVVGTVALLDIGEKQAALRKMFVHPSFRGSEFGTAKLLLNTLIEWSSRRGLADILLGTTAKFLAAHRFYEKHGFKEIHKETLPPSFPVMTVDTKFYKMQLAR